MPDYDPIECGNDNPFVKRNGTIVAFFAHSWRSRDQLSRSAPGIRSFLVPWAEDSEEDPILLCGVTPQDALEALRRKEPQVAAKVEAGTLPMWKKVLEEVSIPGVFRLRAEVDAAPQEGRAGSTPPSDTFEEATMPNPKITVAIGIDGGIEVGVLGIDPKDILIIGLDNYEFSESEGTGGLSVLEVSDLRGWAKDEDSLLGLANERGLLPDGVKAKLWM